MGTGTPKSIVDKAAERVGATLNGKWTLDALLAAAPVAREALPNAVRLVITLAGRKLTRDIALGPQGS